MNAQIEENLRSVTGAALAALILLLPTVTAASPGITIGVTSYDEQHQLAQGRQVAKRPGSNTVHFCWTRWDVIPASPDQEDRRVFYNSYDIATATLNQGSGGADVSHSDSSRSGFAQIDVGTGNLAHMVMHQRDSALYPYTSWHLGFPVEGGAAYNEFELPNPVIFPDQTEIMWPDLAVERNAGAGDIYHVIAQGVEEVGGAPELPVERFWYYRYDAGAPLPFWEGPVLIDSSEQLSYSMAADENSNAVALVFTSDWSTDGFGGRNNVAYRESETSGVGWISSAELGELNKNFVTTYSAGDTSEAWLETSTEFDHSGDLHVLYIEQRMPGSEQMALMHWSKSRGTTRKVAIAYYDNANVWLRLKNLGHISLGVGDGSTLCDGSTNEDDLYATFVKLGGETRLERRDKSLEGFSNGEIYISVSRDGGDYWSNPINLTYTKTPGCSAADPGKSAIDCESEAWASLARTVDDIHIVYVADNEAGAFHEAFWTVSPVKYLRIPGGTPDDPILCARPAPTYVAELDSNTNPCGYYQLASGDIDSTYLAFDNLGPGALHLTILTEPSGPQWLNVEGMDSADADVPIGFTVQGKVGLDATGMAPGIYDGRVLIYHNDHLQTNPDTIPITLAVDLCPNHGDPQPDGFVNVLDVVQTVNVAFKGDPEVTDPQCPNARTDVNCDGVSNVLDVVKMVNVAFKGALSEAEFCHPCAFAP